MAVSPVRVQKWDNVKFFLIFLVVLGHIADIYANVSPATGILYLFIKIIDFFAKWAATGRQPRFDLFSEASVPWYAFCLFAFSIITIIVSGVKPAYVLAVSVILACAAGYDRNIGDFLCLSRIIVYFPFFYAGFITDREKLENLLKSKRIKVLSLLILTAAGFVIATYYGDIKNIKFTSYSSSN